MERSESPVYEDMSNVNLVDTQAPQSEAFEDFVDFEFDNDNSDIDADYVPDSCDSDSDFDNSFVAVGTVVHSKHADALEHKQNNFESPEHQMICQTDALEKENSLPPEPKKIDQGARRERSKKPDKKHYCVFCGVPQTKLQRHLTTVHSNEREIIPFLSSIGTSGKKNELAKLRNAGDHLHNVQVLKSGQGDLVVKRLLKKDNVSQDEFVPCPNCMGYFFVRDLWRHKCPEREKSSVSQNVKAGRLLLPQEESSEGLQELLESLRKDQISLVIKNDELIIMLARREFLRNGHDRDRHSHIRNKLREMGRLLIAVRKITGQESAQFKEFMRPQNFKDIVEATKEIAGFTDNSKGCKTPALAMKIGHSLMKCCTLLKARAIEERNEIVIAECNAFLELHKIQWNSEISTLCCRTLYENKKNKSTDLPLLEDISKLSQHLTSEAQGLKDKLTGDEESHELQVRNWTRLAELTLASIILFNRKRQGEASKMTIEDYKNGIASKNHSDDVLTGLSEFEQSLCKKLTRIEITGKRGRIVPIILTKEMKSSTDLLLELRQQVGVHADNPYFFARNGGSSSGHIRGSDCLKKFTEEIQLTNPGLLRSTKLRKQIATLTQVVNLTENELDVVAQYLGHDIRVHREHYRLPSSTMQVAKVAKILLALDKGELPEDVNNDNSDVEECADLPTPASEDDCPYTSTKGKGNNVNRSKEKPSVLRNMAGRKRWSDEEEAAIMRGFRRQISLACLPGKALIDKVISSEPALSNRSWIQVKNFIRNFLKKTSS